MGSLERAEGTKTVPITYLRPDTRQKDVLQMRTDDFQTLRGIAANEGLTVEQYVQRVANTVLASRPARYAY